MAISTSSCVNSGISSVSGLHFLVPSGVGAVCVLNFLHGSVQIFFF